mgnify:CR=1 FL=1
MTRKLTDVPLERIAIKHYLFDLGYPIKTVSEIYGMDEESVRKIHDEYKRCTPVKGGIK